MKPTVIIYPKSSFDQDPTIMNNLKSLPPHIPGLQKRDEGLTHP